MKSYTSLLEIILGLANKSGFAFSDLLIEERQPIVAGTPLGLVDVLEVDNPEPEQLTEFYALLDPEWEEKLARGETIDRAKKLVDWRLRFCGYKANGKYMLTVRRIMNTPPSLHEIGLSKLQAIIKEGSGLIIVNGRTSSGKSTTVASMVDSINKTKRNHIITIEDPIEFEFVRDQSIFSQREIGEDVTSFYEGVRAANRQRPDVLVIGEVRDRATAEQVLLASESGPLVIVTLHANDVEGAIHKLLSFFPADERDARRETLSKTLLAIVSQKLLPNVDGSGWVLAAELLFNHKQQVKDMIGNPQQIRQHFQSDADKWACSMQDSLADLVKKKLVNKDVAILAASSLYQEKLRTHLKDF